MAASPVPSPRASVPSVTVLLLATLALATEPVPLKASVSDPTRPLIVVRSLATAFVVASYKRVPLKLITFGLTVKLCVPPVNV